MRMSCWFGAHTGGDLTAPHILWLLGGYMYLFTVGDDVKGSNAQAGFHERKQSYSADAMQIELSSKIKHAPRK